MEIILLLNVIFFCILFGLVVFEEVNNRKIVVCEVGNYVCLVFGEECDLFWLLFKVLIVNVLFI